MSEPIITTPNPAGTGRPIISEDQYKLWLEELRPHLELACSLYRACTKAGLEEKYKRISEKYALNDWFSEKVDAYRRVLGENINEVLARITNKALDRAKRDETLTKEDVDVVKYMGEKHRTAQPFFVNRTETAQAKEGEVGKILDTIEQSDYDKLGTEAKGQMVANDTPIQSQE